MAEDFVRKVCETCGLQIYCSTNFTGNNCTVFLRFIRNNSKVFEVVAQGFEYRDTYNKAWKNCFLNTQFTGYVDNYVNLLSLTDSIETMNLYNLN